MLPETCEVPGGWYWRGSANGRPDEAPPTRVEVRRFALGRTPVTNLQYAAFAAARGLAPAPFAREPDFCQPDQPVVGITWFEARDYCQWLSDAEGSRWRLPTENEWERAARGGIEQAATAWGAEVPAGELPEGPLRGPWRVGLGTPNGYGLLDIGTIVHEWCEDVYTAPGISVVVGSGERRSSRGGSWRHHVRWSPPSARSSLPPGSRYADYGFRVLRELR